MADSDIRSFEELNEAVASTSIDSTKLSLISRINALRLNTMSVAERLPGEYAQSYATVKRQVYNEAGTEVVDSTANALFSAPESKVSAAKATVMSNVNSESVLRESVPIPSFSGIGDRWCVLGDTFCFTSSQWVAEQSLAFRTSGGFFLCLPTGFIRNGYTYYVLRNSSGTFYLTRYKQSASEDVQYRTISLGAKIDLSAAGGWTSITGVSRTQNNPISNINLSVDGTGLIRMAQFPDSMFILNSFLSLFGLSGDVNLQYFTSGGAFFPIGNGSNNTVVIAADHTFVLDTALAGDPWEDLLPDVSGIENAISSL